MKIDRWDLCRVLLAVVYIVIPACYVYCLLGKPLVGTDDANILFVYARNFAHGNGIVYNAGGEHVEGFSCILYFLVTSFFYLLSDTPEAGLLIFNGLLSVVSCVMLLKILPGFALKKSNKNGMILSYFLLLLWCVISPGFYSWNIVSLMDNGLYCFMLVCFVCFFYKIIDAGMIINKKDRAIFSVLVLLLFLTRPEGVLWDAFFLCAYFALIFDAKRNLYSSIKEMFLPVSVLLLAIGALTLFRIIYFGYPLPNTYYAKVSASFASTLRDGISYLIKFLKEAGFVFLLLLLPGLTCPAKLIFGKKLSDVDKKHAFISVFCVVALLTPVLEGGDHFKLFRFYQSSYPMLILPAILLLHSLSKRTSTRKFYVLFSVCCISICWANNAGWKNFIRNNGVDPGSIENVDYCIRNEFIIAIIARENGKNLSLLYKSDLPVIGFGSGGGIKYTYDGIVYDLMGLSDTRMAHADDIKIGPKGHQSFNKKIFYELAPDILMPTVVPGSLDLPLEGINHYYTDVNGWDNLIFKNIFNDTEFKQNYSLALVVNKEVPSMVCYGFFNKRYLEKLSQTNNFMVRVASINYPLEVTQRNFTEKAGIQ